MSRGYQPQHSKVSGGYISVDVLPTATINSAQGKDVSNYQPVQSVSSWNGYAFGIAKATESTNFRDATFASNWRNMKSAGIVRGAYHFFHPAVDPVAQAQFFVDTVKAQGLGPGDILVADIEITSGNAFTRFFGRMGGKKYRNNLTQKPLASSLVNASARIFLDEVKKLVGTKNPIVVYSDLSVASLLTSCTGYPLWIAYYSSNFSAPGNVSPWKKWVMWQWGIVGNVDRDAFNGTKTDLKAWVDSYNPPAPKGPPYRHVVTSPISLADLAKSRNEVPKTVMTHQALYFTDADAKDTVYESGSVYYTLFP